MAKFLRLHMGLSVNLDNVTRITWDDDKLTATFWFTNEDYSDVTFNDNEWGIVEEQIIRMTEGEHCLLDGGEDIGTGATGEGEAREGVEAWAARMEREDREYEQDKVPPVSGTHIDTTAAVEAFAELIAESGVQPGPVQAMAETTKETTLFPFDATTIDTEWNDNPGEK